MQGLSFQGNAHNARELHLGNTPLHSIFFRGILGGEILDDSINFIPDWTILKKDVNFSFYYRRKKIDTFADRTKKILEFFS